MWWNRDEKYHEKREMVKIVLITICIIAMVLCTIGSIISGNFSGYDIVITGVYLIWYRTLLRRRKLAKMLEQSIEESELTEEDLKSFEQEDSWDTEDSK